MFISLIFNLFINRLYKIGYLKVIIFTVFSTMFGALSSMIMSYIESGNFTGTSFFGAVFLTPIFVCGLSIILKEEKWKLLNLTSFLGMITSAVLKYRCYSFGCCSGRPILLENYYFIFPSQIVEMLFAIFIFFLLLILLFMNNNRKDLYPIAMIVYGIGRFILNSFRRTTPIIGFMAYGHIWSILSVIIGIIWLFILYNKKCNE